MENLMPQLPMITFLVRDLVIDNMKNRKSNKILTNISQSSKWKGCLGQKQWWRRVHMARRFLEPLRDHFHRAITLLKRMKIKKIIGFNMNFILKDWFSNSSQHNQMSRFNLWKKKLDRGPTFDSRSHKTI